MKIYSRMFTLQSSRRMQQGMSLVELMVAVTIALFMMLSFIAVFINMKTTFITQDAMSQLQDRERLVMTVLTSTTQQTGYFPYPETSNRADNFIVRNDTTPKMIAGQVLSGISNALPASDVLAFRYLTKSGDNTTDCFGNTNTSGTDQAMFHLFTVNGNNQLTCQVGDTNLNSQQPVAIASDIDSLSVLYMIDTQDASKPYQYKKASDVTDWSQVKAVKITVRFENTIPQFGTNTIDWSQTINLMNNYDDI